MFPVRKNQIIVTTLVVMVAVAGYLNFTHTDSVEMSSAENDVGYNYEALIDDGADITVLADDEDTAQAAGSAQAETAQTETGLDPLTAQADYTSEDDDTGAAIFVNAASEADTYFVQAKFEREQSRAKQKDILTEMINNENLDAEQKANFAQGMLDIQQRIEKETAAEAMIKAKGFNEAYVRIDDETVDVVVNSEQITDAQAAQIQDIVKRKTGLSSDKIRISTIKKS